MCIFTHFAAGALVGGLSGNNWAAAGLGLASHAALDACPHYDHPDWRVESGAGILMLVVLLMLPCASWPAVVGGLAGVLPDLENLLQKLGRMKRSSFIFPSHTGLIPHGRALGVGHLGWQIVLAAVCFLLLCLLHPGEATAASAESTLMAEAEIVPLSLSDRVSVIRISLPVESGPLPGSGRDQIDVNWGAMSRFVPSADGTSQRAGRPSIGLVLAVPTRAPLRWRVTDVQWWREPAHRVNDDDLLDPGPVRLFRGVPLAGFTIRPDGGAGGVLQSLTLTIEHTPSGPYRGILADARGTRGSDGGSLAPGHVPATVVNRALCGDLLSGCRLLRLTASRKMKAPHPFALSDNWLRCELSETGVYAISGDDMRNRLVNLDMVDPLTLRMFKGGGRAVSSNPEVADEDQLDSVTLNEIAIEVVDSVSGWDSADEVRFYGFGGDVWLDRFDSTAPALARYEHPFDGIGVYWLTWEDFGVSSPHPGSPLRIDVVPATPFETTPTVSFTARQWEEYSYVEANAEVQDNWFWQSNISGQGGTPTFSFSLPALIAGSETEFLVDVRGVGAKGTPTGYDMVCDIWFNDDEAGAVSSTWTYSSMRDSLRIRVTGTSTALSGGQNTLYLRNRNETWVNTIRVWDPLEGRYVWIEVDIPALKMALDSFGLLYRRSLLKGLGGQMEFSHWGSEVSAPDEEIDLQIALETGQGDVQVWDVSTASTPLELTGSRDTDLTIGLTRQPSANFHAVVFGPGDVLEVDSARLLRPPSLRDDVQALDYVVVYGEGFRTAALDLAAYRATSLPGLPAGVSPRVGAFSVGEIYDSFSGGPKDLYAIRDFLHFVYELPAPVSYPPEWEGLRFVCFVGDATDDPRNYLGAQAGIDLYDFVPTEIRNEFPDEMVATYWNHPYASDDGLVSFDASLPGYEDVPDVPEVACGRLTVNSAAEAMTRVNRIIDFCGDPDSGPWRNKIVFVADDRYQCDSWDASGLSHTRQAERLAAALPVALDMEKVYLVEYDSPAGSCAKEEARFDLLRELSAGFTVFYYVGHGSSWNLSDEQVYMKDDSGILTNENRGGVFLAFSCAVGEYAKRTDQSLAEVFVSQDDGAGVAAICASDASTPNANDDLSSAFFYNMYPDSVDVEATLGESLFLAKAAQSPDDPVDPDGEIAVMNFQRYLLFGDPATTLPNPADGLLPGVGCLDTLKGGIRQDITVDLSPMEVGSWADAAYRVTVQEAGQDKSTDGLDYFLPGGTIFRGSGEVTGPELEIPLKVVTQMHFGERGRVRVIVTTPGSEYSLGLEVPVERVEDQGGDDEEGPQISIAFADNRYRVKAGTLLEVAISDTSGINILGSNPANSILVEYDRSGFVTNVSDYFAFAAGQYTSGQLSVPVSGDLEMGPHLVSIFASDGLGNAGEDTLSFLMVGEGITAIDDVTVFPNPTPDACRLLFELTDPMVVEWEIYTLAGKRIKTMHEDFDVAGPKIMFWDGRDAEGDEIANGVYLYVLRGTAADLDARRITVTGQIVIMK